MLSTKSIPWGFFLSTTLYFVVNLSIFVVDRKNVGNMLNKRMWIIDEGTGNRALIKKLLLSKQGLKFLRIRLTVTALITDKIAVHKCRLVANV